MPPPSPPLSLTAIQRGILRAVRTRPLTRAEIALQLKLSRSTLSSEILRLLDLGLLASTGLDQSHGGRRSGLLSVGGAEAAVVAGVEIDAVRLRVMIATLGMQALTSRHVETAVNDDPQETLDHAATLIADALEPNFGPLVAIGVSLPATIDVLTGAPVVAPSMPRWIGVPVGSYFANRFATRALTDTDLNALALGESRASHSAPLGSSFLVLKVSEGLGCGIVINDTLYRGSHGAAGEVGHISADLRDSTVCACGNRGCLDVTIGTSDALVRMRDHIAVRDRDLLPAESVLDQRDELSIALIGQATVDGDLLAVTLLKEIGTRLGFMLAGIISFFNPSSVVISGATIPGHGVLLSAIRRTIYEHAFPGSTRRLQIVESGIAEEGVVIGATVLASDGFLGTAGRVAFSTAAREVAELPEVVDA